ncbi:alpha/beta hydrolase [Crateriforma spongiae]|uniref:alpha/beta hydrolase n=1 Tax=Crateriforma spongiae TaxID=2724528 RepID=UPI001444B1CE|nr:alpha/beta hydrolase [Crateriforma spongiae]
MTHPDFAKKFHSNVLNSLAPNPARQASGPRPMIPVCSMPRWSAAIVLGLLCTAISMKASADEAATAVIDIWDGDAPAWNAPQAEESDTSGPDGRKVAGRSVIRLGNVSTPQLHVYPAHADGPGTSTVVIAPGGGYSILAWDLEGTEIAAWLNSVGVDAVVLKYRVPTRSEDQKWLAPVQDIQRSIVMLRTSKVSGVNAQKIGVLGFSAGGNASARALTASTLHYAAHRPGDGKIRFQPDFGVLVYPAWLVESDEDLTLIDEITVDKNTPPAFFAHAIDDRVSCLSSVALFTEMKRNGIPSSLHVFSGGGHGFGLRQADSPTDQWPDLCATWLRQIGMAK